jgi:hypothetical protein
MMIVDFKKPSSGEVIEMADNRYYAIVKWGNGIIETLNKKQLNEHIGARFMGKKRYRFYTGGKEV